jgi:hypothetical protein
VTAGIECQSFAEPGGEDRIADFEKPIFLGSGNFAIVFDVYFATRSVPNGKIDSLPRDYRAPDSC